MLTVEEENAMYEKTMALRAGPPCRIKLTQKCRGFLNGSIWKKSGDEAEVPVEQSQELCSKGEAEPVGVVSWLVAKAKSVITPAATVDPEDDWTKPSAARWVKCRVVPGKKKTAPFWNGTSWEETKARTAGRQVYNARIGRSYGVDEIIFLMATDARRELEASNIELIDPPSLPPARPPEVGVTYPVGRYGCSPMVNKPASYADV
jgi:hypothetical protein